MTIKDLFAETKSAILSNKTRSGLTMLGIVIGIASVIVMLSVGNGASASIQSSIQSIGSNILTISPGGTKRAGAVNTGMGNGQQSLTKADAEAIKEKITKAKYVVPEVTSRAQVVAGSNNTNTTIVGTVSSATFAKNITIDSGIFITDTHDRNFSKVAVLGPTTRDTLFGEGSDSVGKEIRINKATYKVIGVTATKGGSSFSNNDDRIYIPLSTAQQYISGSQYLGSITVSAENSDDLTSMQTEITSLLLARHKISNPDSADFSIFNQQEIADVASSVTSTFTYLLGSVAAISLVVGGIGIMNMMLTIVRERTREIGLRKAIGARRKDISTQFLFESTVLTALGGVIGIIFGWGISYIITLTGITTTQVTAFSVILSFSVSALIGIAFGYYPARSASRLNPIDALRYE